MQLFFVFLMNEDRFEILGQITVVECFMGYSIIELVRKLFFTTKQTQKSKGKADQKHLHNALTLSFVQQRKDTNNHLKFQFYVLS